MLPVRQSIFRNRNAIAYIKMFTSEIRASMFRLKSLCDTNTSSVIVNTLLRRFKSIFSSATQQYLHCHGRWKAFAFVNLPKGSLTQQRWRVGLKLDIPFLEHRELGVELLALLHLSRNRWIRDSCNCRCILVIAIRTKGPE